MNRGSAISISTLTLGALCAVSTMPSSTIIAQLVSQNSNMNNVLAINGGLFTTARTESKAEEGKSAQSKKASSGRTGFLGFFTSFGEIVKSIIRFAYKTASTVVGLAFLPFHFAGSLVGGTIEYVGDIIFGSA